MQVDSSDESDQSDAEDDKRNFAPAPRAAPAPAILTPEKKERVEGVELTEEEMDEEMKAKQVIHVSE